MGHNSPSSLRIKRSRTGSIHSSSPPKTWHSFPPYSKTWNKTPVIDDRDGCDKSLEIKSGTNQGCISLQDFEVVVNCTFMRFEVSVFEKRWGAMWEFMYRRKSNAASGMAVHDDCKLRFLDLKAKRTFRFIVFKIEEKQKQVIVEKLGEPADSYEDFTASLPADECRYAVYDFDYVTEENCQKSRIVFVAWSPDTARVRSKMIYASSKDRFKRELDGIQIELQATDPTEMGLDVIRSRSN
ncbi:hypothetical protein SADUNF_Sadunf10G0161800 [Salix dunnii]|uniref:ADF-H domain-containing protein n=1 Tax=Salix dunnii TaxID=1413687 RepID=A0A835JQV2_9ROSI|nr:hypothetical protein SADUNF_Sadunf10G0161800 [Salix dunnii]